MNRQMTDALADLYFAPTSLSRDNLLKANYDASQIYVTGNSAIDALAYTVTQDFSHEALKNSETKKILITMHRRENLGQNMMQVFQAMNQILDKHTNIEIIFPMHKNPKIRALIYTHLKPSSRLHLIEPLDVFEFHNLAKRSDLILTDSGGIQEEAPSLGVPVLVLRESTERPEGVAAGTLKVVGTSEEDVVSAVDVLLSDSVAYEKMATAQNPYGDGKTSERIVSIIARYFDFAVEIFPEFSDKTARNRKGKLDEKNWLTKLDYCISLEVLVGVTLALYLLQQIAFYELLSEKVFIVSALLTFLGLVLGLLSTSLMLLIVNLMLVSIGAFLLYFDPVIMLTKIKLLLIFVIPMYSVIAFFIKRTLYVRRLIAFREEDIHSYLKFRDPLTGYRTIDSFFSKYQQFVESLSQSRNTSSRLVVVSLFYVDFYDQYFDRNPKATDQMVRDIAENLLRTRNPEELFFYLKKGTFIILSAIYDNELEREKFEKLNDLTKLKLSEIVFKTEQVQNITIRKSDCYISRKTTYTADQVLEYLNRRSETDLAVEYI